MGLVCKREGAHFLKSVFVGLFQKRTRLLTALQKNRHLSRALSQKRRSLLFEECARRAF